MKKQQLTSLLILTCLNSACTETPVLGCSTGWRTTGYFTPLEQDYSPVPRQTLRTSDGESLSLPRDFIDMVKIEGWGKTSAGYYVGKYHGAWHTSLQPLDAQGNALRIGSIATDKRKIPHGAKVTIPILQMPPFTANDIGPSIRGKHIDIFCGEGRSGEAKTFQVTRDNVEVCVAAPNG